jgi:sporulation protein YlmC with PRC-barrel domain
VTREVPLELLLGRVVIDADGTSLGRLEEVTAEYEGDALVVRAFLVGRYAIATRLGAGALGHALVRLLGGGRTFHALFVPWHAMDLSDPLHPRCTMRKAEVERLSRELAERAGGVPTGR